MAPVVLAVELCVIVEPVAVSEVKGVVPPTAPVIATTPPVPPVSVKFCAPLIVLEAEIFAPPAVPPPFVVSATTAPVNATGPVQLIVPPLVVKLLARLIAAVPV